MAHHVINPQELALFKEHSELHAAVRKSIFFAKKATLAKTFDAPVGKNQQAYLMCVYPAFLASMEGKRIAEKYIIAHNSSSDIKPTVRASNLANGNLGISVCQIYFSSLAHSSSGPAKTNTPLPPISTNVNFSANSGEAEPGYGNITDWKALQAIAEACYKLFLVGKLKTDGY